jgi:hypothetical protein
MFQLFFCCIKRLVLMVLDLFAASPLGNLVDVARVATIFLHKFFWFFIHFDLFLQGMSQI